LLKWEVAEQQDIRSYVVERSADGRNYSPIGSIPANNETSFTYQFTDNDPLNGISYYRLQIVEDHTRNYSSILVVNLAGKENALSIYPVPVTAQLKIQVKENDLVNTEAQLLNSAGRLVQKIKLQRFEQTIDIQMLPVGVYFLKTFNGKAYKILKQ